MKELAKTHNQAILLLVLALMDALFTLFFIQSGMATEANPFMAFYYAIHPISFLAVKALLTAGGLYLMIPHLNRRYIQLSIAGLTVVYAFVIIYHFSGLARMVWL